MGNPALALPARYSAAELIASGGMADVYGAHDELLDRRVAVKVLSERFAGDPEIRARFTREARIAARLSNEPHVVTIFDVVEVAGRPAIVMEFLQGGTVADRLGGPARVSPALALMWLGQAARALDAAHVAGVVHRDVKPANLMLAADGGLRVTDFGIARIAGDAALTSVGMILGTSGYMSPEQALGGHATPASDRYGLAVVAFELLSGRRPYTAETFEAEAAAHANAPVPAATSFDHSLPAAVDVALERGLAKEPQQRFRSCGEMVASLSAAFSAEAGITQRMAQPIPPPLAPTSRAPREPRRRLIPVVVLIGLGLLGLVFALVAARADRGAVEQTTVVRTATVTEGPKVRTVTVEAQPARPAAGNSGGPARASGQSGASLNDQGYGLLRAGNATAALPLLERAVDALEGTGSLAEAYASYNLAAARFLTGDCRGIKELLKRSEQVQGKRREINDLKHEASKACRH